MPPARAKAAVETRDPTDPTATRDGCVLRPPRSSAIHSCSPLPIGALGTARALLPEVVAEVIERYEHRRRARRTAWQAHVKTAKA
jgi:hypothetical protein